VSAVDIEEVRATLHGVTNMLQADGYALLVEPADGGIAVTIEATGDACSECLAPETVVREIIQEKLGPSVRLTKLLYPEPHAIAGE
jgi:hypothetical protein